MRRERAKRAGGGKGGSNLRLRLFAQNAGIRPRERSNLRRKKRKICAKGLRGRLVGRARVRRGFCLALP